MLRFRTAVSETLLREISLVVTLADKVHIDFRYENLSTQCPKMLDMSGTA